MTSLQVLYFDCDPLATTNCNKATMTVDLRNLCDLEELWLDRSISSGNITRFPEKLPQCSSNRLQFLSSTSNNMVGIMADKLGQFTTLTRLDLYDNNITGSIPQSIGNLPHLEYLDISNNHFTRPMPLELGNCTCLRYISLSNNNLVEPIPLGIASCT
jgi:Leucine-rich repeat (LRR) protein